MSRPAVILLSGIRWDFLWQRHQILATRFARAGYPTVFVETTGLADPRPSLSTVRKIFGRIMSAGHRSRKRREPAEPVVYSPIVAPPTRGPFRRLNRNIFVPRIARDLLDITGPEPVVIAYPPTRTTLDLISALRPRLLLYDCSEDYSAFPGVPRDIAATERELLGRADFVSCTSRTLLEKVRPERRDAFHSGPGVDYEHFATLQGKNGPGEVGTVCYFGHLSRERTDFSVLRAISEAGFRVRLVGGLGKVNREFLRMPGLDRRGEIPHAELPGALAGVDAFVFPYLINGLTRGIAPAKTYEALATGKPVVTSPIPAMKELGEHVYLAERAGDFVDTLRNLGTLETEEKVRGRADLARRNSWEARFRELEERLWEKL